MVGFYRATSARLGGAQLALCAVSRKAGIFCGPFSSTLKGDGTGMPGICRIASPT